MNNIDLTNEDLVRQLRDPKFYLENFCKIKTKSKGLAPFIFNEAQKDIANTLREYCRIIILKARQLGSSTIIAGLFYVDTIMNPGTNTALIGYNSDLTSELLDKVKTFYRTTPSAIRPTIRYNSKYEISFPAVDSKILVLPSTETVGRGYTLRNCLVTELAFWEKAEEKMAALEASVPIDGHLIIESTPNFVGNLYHRLWVSDNDYIKKEYGWWWGYTKKEIEIIRKRMNNPMRFAAEYELEFLTSGRAVFDQLMVKKMRKNILKVGDKHPVTGDIVEEIDGLRIYRKVKPDDLIVCGGDVSEGVMGGNYSVAIFFDRKTGEEVAFYRGLIAPDRFGDKLDQWGRIFNNALMTIEVNNHGLTTLTVLKQKLYPCIYFRPTKLETTAEVYADKMGWKTNKLTRPLLIDEFSQAVRDGLINIHSKEVLDEMTTFVYDANNDMVPQPGFFDDGIFAAGIGYQGFKIIFDTKDLGQIDISKMFGGN